MVCAITLAIPDMATAAKQGFGMFFLLWILGVLFYQGFSAISPTLFTQMTPPPGQDRARLRG